MGWEVEERFKRKETYVYLWLVHADVWQKPTQHCKAIILQLKINKSRLVEGIFVYIQLIHFAVQQKLTQHRKATILQSKLIKKKSRRKLENHLVFILSIREAAITF